MRTRGGNSYPIRGVAVNACNTAAEKSTSSTNYKRGRPDFTAGEYMVCRKKSRLISTGKKGETDLFDSLPDDLVISILCKLSSSASCPSDFINVLFTCKRLNGLGLHSQVLSKASPKSFVIKAKKWSDSAHRFLKLCADAGNAEACYTLGKTEGVALL
ncbi:hypothetical protein OIU77_022610 [Salix suchowensis]|uniref:F-box domain-containing protein n=1 Tax=Salix suchowensis TaxID=1278906 RepID=A0ABQ9C464_9ROSI|nr:hypothetical protein OIU77_022610 [Salix suchowensis]